MYNGKNSERILELIDMMIDSIHVIQVHTLHIKNGNDFLLNPDDMFLLDGVCMKLIFIGESVKMIDKLSEGKLFPLYPSIPWREIMKLRDVIAHHYFKIDVDIVFSTMKTDLPLLLETLSLMKENILNIRLGNVE